MKLLLRSYLIKIKHIQIIINLFNYYEKTIIFKILFLKNIIATINKIV